MKLFVGQIFYSDARENLGVKIMIALQLIFFLGSPTLNPAGGKCFSPRPPRKECAAARGLKAGWLGRPSILIAIPALG